MGAPFGTANKAIKAESIFLGSNKELVMSSDRHHPYP